jgi:hypothetical protein
MLRLRPVFALFACALMLKAIITGSIIQTDLGTPVDDWDDVVADAPVGQSFSTGNSSYNLTSATVILSGDQNEERAIAKPKIRSAKAHSARVATKSHAKPALTFTLSPPSCAGPCTSASLWSDNGGPGPGVELAVSPTVVLDTALPNSSSPQEFTFSFPSYPLTAHARYWIMVSSPAGNSLAEWWGTDEPSGAVLSEFGIDDGGVFPNGDDNDFAEQLQVNGIATTTPPATPAPSSLPLVLGGLLCSGIYLTLRRGRGFRARSEWLERPSGLRRDRRPER